MKTVSTRGLVVLGSLMLSTPAFAGQIVRSTSGGREVVTLVDHGQTRGRAALHGRPTKRETARSRAAAQPLAVECPATPDATVAAANIAPSMLAYRLEKGDSTEVPDVGTDPTAYDLRVVGAVENEATRRAVAARAMELLAADSVRNELRLMYEWDGNPYLVYDEPHVQERVERALLTWPALHAADIRVSVDKGVTTLTGSVASEDDRVLATTAAASTPGVYLVQNRLNLSPD